MTGPPGQPQLYALKSVSKQDLVKARVISIITSGRFISRRWSLG